MLKVRLNKALHFYANGCREVKLEKGDHEIEQPTPDQEEAIEYAKANGYTTKPKSAD